MRNLLTVHSGLRLVALLVLAIPVAAHLFAHHFTINLQFTGLCVLCADCLLLVYPGERSNLRDCSIYALAVLSLIMFCILLPIDFGIRAFIMLAGMFAYLLVISLKKYKQVRSLFFRTSIWQGVEDYSRLFWALIIFLLGAFYIAVLDYVWARGVAHVLLLAYFVLRYNDVFCGRTLFLGPEKEKLVKDILKGVACKHAPESDEELSRLNALCKKAETVLVEQKLYLDPHLTLEKLAKASFSNKTYLSKAINSVTDDNFNYLVNKHRVAYAVELIKDDPHLLMKEVAHMSGFCTPVSFTAAFELHMKMPPSRFCREYVIAANPRSLPSSFEVQEQSRPSLFFLQDE